MEHFQDRSVRQCAGIFLCTVLVGAALQGAYALWPGTALGLFAPVNESVWELSKIALWPTVVSALLFHAKERERGSLCAYLMVAAALPVALLFVYWFLRMVCGICSDFADRVVWITLLAAGDMTALSLRDTGFVKQALPMALVLVLVWAFAYTVFALRGVDLPIFVETMGTIGW